MCAGVRACLHLGACCPWGVESCAARHGRVGVVCVRAVCACGVASARVWRVVPGPWSAEEEDILRTCFPELGKQWVRYAAVLPGRSISQVGSRGPL